MNRIVGKTFDEWLQEFKPKIVKAISSERLDNQIICSIRELLLGPVYITRLQVTKPQPNQFSINSRSELVTPTPIRFEVPLQSWLASPETFAMDYYLEEVGRVFAALEANVSINQMLNEAHEITSTENRLTKFDIIKATGWVQSQGHYADILIVHPLQYVSLIQNNEILESWKIDPNFARGLGRNFCGIVDGTKAYRTSSIHESFALAYDKSRSAIKRSNLNIVYDNPSSPSNLIIEESRITWFLQKGAAAKVHFSPTG